jgi:adenine-specific DNA-methyltransferase
LINPKNGDKYPVNPNRSWAVTKDTVDDYIDRGKIVFPGDYDFLNINIPSMRIFKSEEIKKNGEDFDKTYVSSDFLNKAMDDLLGTATYNKKGTDEMVALFGSKRFDYPKPELLLERIIEYATEPNDIILDFFAGSGTTGAVAHKMNRRYILIEQMEEQVQIIKERLEKVIKGDQSGISKEIGWQGGGHFTYAELMQWNSIWKKRIKSANKSDLPNIWKNLQKKAHLSWRTDLSKISKNAVAFSDLSKKDMQKFLLDTLDNNHLYVNYSEMEDETYEVSDEDKALNNQFYTR